MYVCNATKSNVLAWIPALKRLPLGILRPSSWPLTISCVSLTSGWLEPLSHRQTNIERELWTVPHCVNLLVVLKAFLIIVLSYWLPHRTWERGSLLEAGCETRINFHQYYVSGNWEATVHLERGHLEKVHSFTAPFHGFRTVDIATWDTVRRSSSVVQKAIEDQSVHIVYIFVIGGCHCQVWSTIFSRVVVEQGWVWI